jgi:hypothetical protein
VCFILDMLYLRHRKPLDSGGCGFRDSRFAHWALRYPDPGNWLEEIKKSLCMVFHSASSLRKIGCDMGSLTSLTDAAVDDLRASHNRLSEKAASLALQVE